MLSVWGGAVASKRRKSPLRALLRLETVVVAIVIVLIVAVGAALRDSEAGSEPEGSPAPPVDIPADALDIEATDAAADLPDGPVEGAVLLYGQGDPDFPDSAAADWTLVTEGGDHYRLPTEGGAALLSADGTRLAYQGPDGSVVLRNLADGTVQNVAVPAEPSSGLGHAWSHDGRWLLLDPWLIDTTNGQYRQLPNRTRLGEPPEDASEASREQANVSEVTIAGILPDGNLVAVAPTYAEDLVVMVGVMSPEQFPWGEYQAIDLTGVLEQWEGIYAIGSTAGTTAVLSSDGSSVAVTIYDNRHEGSGEPNPPAAAIVTINHSTGEVISRYDLPENPNRLEPGSALNGRVCNYDEQGVEFVNGWPDADGNGDVHLYRLDPATQDAQITIRLRVDRLSGFRVAC